MWTYRYIFIEFEYDTKNIGLYRDEELSVFKNCSGPQMEEIKKHLQKVFKNNGLDIIIECNTKVVNYLGVTFNLNDSTYWSYEKSGLTPLSTEMYP